MVTLQNVNKPYQYRYVKFFSKIISKLLFFWTNTLTRVPLNLVASKLYVYIVIVYFADDADGDNDDEPMDEL